MFEMKKKIKWHRLKTYSALKKKVQILSIHLNPYILVLIIFRIPSSSKFHPGLGKNGSEHRPETALPMHLWSLGSCLKRNKPSMKTQRRLNTSKSLIYGSRVRSYIDFTKFCIKPKMLLNSQRKTSLLKQLQTSFVLCLQFLFTWS